MGSFLGFIGIVFLGALLIVFAGFAIYNSLVQKKITCENAWSQIDVQLKRRHDLIPNLIESVKGYSKHEKETLERVIQARNSAISAADGGDIGKRSQAEGALTQALRQIFALSESYPDLKANQNFLALQEELTSTENRIGFARQHYNDSVAAFNTAIQTVPNNIVAGMGGFSAKTFFEVDPSEAEAIQKPPQVSF